MKKVKLNSIIKNKRVMYLAYDQGMEHGPEHDFDDKNIDPLYVLNIAKKGKFDGIIFQKGIAEKYNKEIKKSKVPLIVKLNGKTKLFKGEPLSSRICSVKEAVELGAKAVGYTIYIGSKHENLMIKEFSEIEREAHNFGIPVIVWVYPRGKSIKEPTSRENIAYSARVGLELGADLAKINWNGNLDDLKWAVKSAGRCKIVIAGGNKKSEKEFLEDVKKIKISGALGIAVGRNVWKSEKPIELSKKIRKILS
jgi:class I fructose-bisphosphate aldolase